MKRVFEKHELAFRKKPEALTNFWLRLITSSQVRLFSNQMQEELKRYAQLK
jgi:hypothetical protein